MQTIIQDKDGSMFPHTHTQKKNQPFSKPQTEIVYFPKY